jgi:hypothetical protein
MTPNLDDAFTLAAEQCRRYGMEITVTNLATNVAMRPGDFTALMDIGLKQRARAWCRRNGYITNDPETNTKVSPKDAKVSDAEALLEIKRRNKLRVDAQYEALEAAVKFLRVKRDELGYDPYIYLFEEDVRRIYQHHGLDLPIGWGKSL